MPKTITMTKEKSTRNRTLTLSPEEALLYKERIVNKKDLSHTKDFINKTINSDLIEALKFLPNQFADLIIIDPPYNLSKDFQVVKFKSMNDDDYEKYLQSWFPLVCEKLKPNGTLYICGDWKCTSTIQRIVSKNLTILNRITWQREKGRGAKTNWKNGMEDIWFAVKNQKSYYFNVEAVKLKRKVIAPYKENGNPKDWENTENGAFRITYPSNFWDDISIPFWSMPENTDHPTQKPEKLYAKLILASSRPGDIVFDPFLGSGTASVVAKKLNRRYCGIEINTEYCLWAEKRIELANTNSTIQGYTDGVFCERNTLGLQIKNTNSTTNKESL